MSEALLSPPESEASQESAGLAFPQMPQPVQPVQPRGGREETPLSGWAKLSEPLGLIAPRDRMEI